MGIGRISGERKRMERAGEEIGGRNASELEISVAGVELINFC